jgi:urease beta subunit
MTPGEIIPAEGTVLLNAGRQVTTIDVINRGDRPIQVGSHFHFFEVNRALDFDRAQAYGKRLDIPSGTATRFEPGETKRVDLIPFGGRGIVRGLNGLVDGPLAQKRESALAEAAERGFGTPA